MKLPNPVVTLELFAVTVSMRVVGLRLGNVGDPPAALQQTRRHHCILTKVRVSGKTAGLLQSNPAVRPEGIRKENRFEAYCPSAFQRTYRGPWRIVEQACMGFDRIGARTGQLPSVSGSYGWVFKRSDQLRQRVRVHQNRVLCEV